MKEKLSAATEESAEYIPVRARKKIFKAAAAVAVAAAFAVGACVFVPKFFEESVPNVVDEGFVTVSAPVPKDGSTPDMHTALENIAYMNAAFKAQESWYSEMHGTTDASIMKQSVSTFKQYSDGVLIVADITSSAMVKAARQFCYTGDEVMWRLGSTYDASTYEEMLSAEWKSGEPYAHMYLKDFIAENGLPATEFSVYIINEETLLSADEVVKNQDGTYSQTYYLDPAGDKAPAHYANQMVFSGGLTALPEFTSIRITYTFDDEWQVLESVVEESYKATMGISVNCSSAFTTQYEYGTERAKSSAYEDYFKQYAGGEVSGPEDSVPTAVGCLGEAFGSVLTGPVVFDLSLTLNGTPLEGAVYLDIGDMTPDTIALRADFGILQLWLEEGEAYLQYGGIRGKLALEELMGALPLSEGGEGLDLDALLAGLGEGEFSYDETSASLSAQLSLGSLSLPVQFSFLLDENGHASLGNVSTQIEREGLALSLELAYGKEAPAALPEAEKADFPDLLPHLRTIASLLTSDAVRAEIAYEGSIAGEAVSLRGVLNVPLASGAVGGELALTLHGAEKQLSFAYSDGAIFLEVDGLKLKADAEEAISFLGQYLELPALETEGLSFDLDTLLESALSGELSSLVSVSGKEEALIVAVKGNELLELLGMDLGTFGLGEVVLTSENGVVTAEALGASIAISEGELVSVDADAYTDILPYAKTLADIFSTGYFRADVDIDIENFNIFGTVYFGIDPVVVRAKLYLSTGGLGKLVTVEYAGDDLFAIIDGVTLRLDAEELISLLTSSLPLGSEEEKEAVDYLHNFLSLDFSKVVPSLSEEDGVLSLIVNGNEIMRALGIKYLTGNIELAVDGESLSASCEALHFDITLYKGNPVYINSEQDCIDVQPVLQKLLKMIEEKAFSFDGSLSLEAGGVQLPVNIQRGTLSWEYGFSVTLEGELSLGGGWHRFFLSADSTRVRIAYGGLGISLAYDEFPALAETLLGAFEEIGSLAEEIGITLPDLSSLSGALQNLDGLSGGFDLASFDLGALLSGLTMTEVPGGLFGLSGENITLTVADERFGIASVGLGYTGEGFSLGAGLSLDEFEEPLTMPRITYLGMEEIEELSGYLTSAARLLGEECIKAQLTFDGITLDIWLDNRETSESGGAGVYVSVSRFAGQEGYAPLELWASAEEFKSILASAGALLGVELPVMGDVDQDIAARLQVIGESLFTTLRSELGDLLGGSGSVSKELISDFSMKEDGVSLTLGGGALGMGSDLSLFLNKPAEGTASLAGGIATGGTQIDFSLTGDTMPALPEQSAESALVGKYEVTGIGALLSSLAKTATHKATEEEIVSGAAESADDILLNRTYFIDGSIEVDAALDLEIFEIPVKEYEVELSALAVTIEENGGITLSVRLKYGDLSAFGIDLIYGSTLDLTFKGDMIYMRRVSDGETLYRAMPLSVFGETIMDQLVFMFNMSDDVANILTGISPEEKPSELQDLGTQAEGILRGYKYQDGAWVLTFNGGALTGNVLGDIKVTLGTDENGCISSLGVIAGIEKTLFKVDLSADLVLQNAGENYGNVFEEDIDLSDCVAKGMGAAIENNKANGWSTYLEGTPATITLEYNGETETQKVFVNGETVLTKIDFPELEEKEGHTLKWVQSGLTFKPEYTPNIYHVQFTTEDALADGFEKEYELAYGSKIEYYVNGELRSTDTVGAGDMTLEMPVLDERSVWYKAEASGDVLRLYAYENHDTVTFDDGFGGTSTENFVADYALPTPTKEGYTFLGWWKETDNGWKKADSLAYSGGADVTLHALWVTELGIKAETEWNWGDVFPKTLLVSYNSDIQFEGTPASEIKCTLSMEYYVKYNKDLFWSAEASGTVDLMEIDGAAWSEKYSGGITDWWVKVKFTYYFGEVEAESQEYNFD